MGGAGDSRGLVDTKEESLESKQGGLTHSADPYLCFCGPLSHLVLLASSVCTFWNELSVYKLENEEEEEEEEGPSVAETTTTTLDVKSRARQGTSCTSVASTSMGSMYSSITSPSARSKHRMSY